MQVLVATALLGGLVGLAAACSLIVRSDEPKVPEFEACWQSPSVALDLRNPEGDLLEGRLCLASGPQVLALAGRAPSQVLAVLDGTGLTGTVEQVTVLRDAAAAPENDTVIVRVGDGAPSPILARSAANPCPCPLAAATVVR